MWRRAPTSLVPRILALVPLTLIVGACSSGGGKGFADENDRLRAQVIDLENQIKTLKSRNGELEAQLAQASHQATTVPADVVANTPRVASIALSRLSQARDENNDGKLDAILLYLQPSDGMGRFLQIVGSVSMHAAILPADAPAKTIGQATIGPRELREAYRSSFTGQYYSLTLPIEAPPAGTSQCTVRVEFTDGYTGQTLSAESVIDLK